VIFQPALFAIGKKSLLEAAQLATVDLDAMGVAVLGYLTLVNLVLSGNGECLRAGDPLFNPFCLEGLCDLVSVHGNNVLCASR
jgi:hypothetical protein